MSNTGTFRGDLRSKQADTNRGVRRLIVSTFESVCVALVILPTAAAAFIALNSNTGVTGFWLLATIAIFVGTSFLAGGGLTLVEIARNTRALVGILNRIGQTERITFDEIAKFINDWTTKEQRECGEITCCAKLSTTKFLRQRHCPARAGIAMRCSPRLRDALADGSEKITPQKTQTQTDPMSALPKADKPDVVATSSLHTYSENLREWFRRPVAPT
jgi:hypothetical protein